MKSQAERPLNKSEMSTMNGAGRLRAAAPRTVRPGAHRPAGSADSPPRNRKLGTVNQASVKHSHTLPNDAVPRPALWILVPAAALTILGMILLWPQGVEDAEAIEAYGTEIDGHVLSVHETECEAADADLNEQLQATVCGDVVVRLTSGDQSGEEAVVDIPSGPGAPVVRPATTSSSSTRPTRSRASSSTSSTTTGRVHCGRWWSPSRSRSSRSDDGRGCGPSRAWA